MAEATAADNTMPEKLTPTEAREKKVITQVNGRQWGMLLATSPPTKQATNAPSQPTSTSLPKASKKAPSS